MTAPFDAREPVLPEPAQFATFDLLSASDAELALAEDLVRQAMGPIMVELMQSRGFDVGTSLRLTALGQLFAQAREDAGLTVKEAAARLRVAQYRLRDVESGAPRMDAKFVARYAEFLGIKSGVSAWAARFPATAASVGLASPAQP